MENLEDSFKILGIKARNPSWEEIKSHYREKALETHPDKGGDQEKFLEINDAYELIKEKYSLQQIGSQFSEDELEGALERAFKNDLEATILVDGWTTNEFLSEGIHLGIERGYLFKSSELNEEQYTAEYYSLTKKGKEHFGLKTIKE